MRILVTGAAGFIGSNLTKTLLAENFEVIGIDDLSAGTLENVTKKLDFRKQDICETSLAKHFEGVDVVFHLAAKNCLADCAENPVDTARINVMGTANVLDACVRNKVGHVIYSDTSAEYEGILEFPSVIEKTKPLSVYACSKQGGALMCQGFANYYGLNVSTVRYFNVYGPAQDWRRVIPPVMSAFTIKLLTGEQPKIYGSGKKRRDFIHVDDVNAFHLKLIREKALQGGTYNLGTGEDYSVLEIFEKIRSIVGSKIEPEFCPELPGEAERTLADLTQTKETGWNPKIGLNEGLSRFIGTIRNELGKTIPTAQ